MSIDRLSGEDRLMLQVDLGWPQDVGAIAMLPADRLTDAQGRVRMHDVRAQLSRRLHLVPRLRQVVHDPGRGLGGPLWLDARDFDLRQHVQLLPLPEGSGEAELLDAVERLRRTRLDPSRPLWEMWFLPGLRDGRVALFVRMHHALGDGRAAMTMLGALLDSAPASPGPPAPPWRPVAPPSTRSLFVDGMLRRARSVGGMLAVVLRPRATYRQLQAALPSIRELLAEEPASKTSIDRLIGPTRRFALERSTVEQVRHAARVHDASVNDVLLAATAGGLRALFRHRGEPVEDVTLRIFVPVSLRGRTHGAIQGNRISQMVVPLDLGISDPAARLRGIAAQTARRKALSRPSLGMLFAFGPIRRMMLTAIVRQRVNVTSASLPGPRHTLYLAGAPILELFPTLNLVGNQPLGVAALSYAGTFHVCVTADGDAFPDLGVFATGLRADLDALGASGSRTEHREPLIDAARVM